MRLSFSYLWLSPTSLTFLNLIVGYKFLAAASQPRAATSPAGERKRNSSMTLGWSRLHLWLRCVFFGTGFQPLWWNEFFPPKPKLDDHDSWLTTNIFINDRWSFMIILHTYQRQNRRLGFSGPLGPEASTPAARERQWRSCEGHHGEKTSRHRGRGSPNGWCPHSFDIFCIFLRGKNM